VSYLMLTPALIVYIALRFYPFFSAIKVSFYKWSPATPPKFIGLRNYYSLIFLDPKFTVILKNTVMYTLMSLPPTIILALFLAILLNQIKYKKFFRACYFIPVVASMAVVASIWKALFHPDYGLITPILVEFGMTRIDFLHNPKTALPAIALVAVWKNVGFQMIIFLAGLQGIPRMYHEAAKLDGANRVQTFIYITFPLLSPILAFVVITGFISTFQVFDQVYVMTVGMWGEVGAPGDSTLVYMLYLWSQGFRFFNMGYASALGVFMFIILFLVTMFNLKITKAKRSIY